MGFTVEPARAVGMLGAETRGSFSRWRLSPNRGLSHPRINVDRLKSFRLEESEPLGVQVRHPFTQCSD